ncbi:MAG TPA: hypothetical protein VK420_13370 [Longimicrobium sp.]|nr:hypothetical protein [Longimicrobium sp.]
MDAIHTPPLREIDDQIHLLREAALRFGAEMNMLERATCDHEGCTRPGCPDSAMETVTLGRILGVLADEWDPDHLSEDPGTAPTELRRVRRLRQALLEFGSALGLFVCDCGEEWCPKRTPHALTTLDLLAVVAGEWHARAGCLFRCQHSVGADRIARTEATLDRNRTLLGEFRQRLEGTSVVEREAVALRSEEAAGTLTYREARAAASHAIEVWVMERGYRDAEVDRIHHLLREIRGDSTAGGFVRAVTDAVDALLLRDVLAAEMCDALYGPVEPCIPLAAIRADRPGAHTRWAALN